VHYGSYTSFCLKDRQYSVRPLFYLRPRADAGPLVLRIVEDLLMLSTTGVVVHVAFSTQDVTVHVYPCIGIFDFPLAAKFSSTIGAPGVKHCTSCDIVSQKTSSVRQDRAMNSTQVFDRRHVTYARIQERTEVIESTIDRSLMSSDAANKIALHANGR